MGCYHWPKKLVIMGINQLLYTFNGFSYLLEKLYSRIWFLCTSNEASTLKVTILCIYFISSQWLICDMQNQNHTWDLLCCLLKKTGSIFSYKTKLFFPACLSVHQYVWHHQLASHSSLTKATSLAALEVDRAYWSRLTNLI